jgi:hypothetical protein
MLNGPQVSNWWYLVHVGPGRVLKGGGFNSRKAAVKSLVPKDYDPFHPDADPDYKLAVMTHGEYVSQLIDEARMVEEAMADEELFTS